MKKYHLTEFIREAQELPLLDVRSPAEFETGHLPGAISFPLFSNEERAEIGTLYKQEGKPEAIKRGLDIIGPKMRQFIEKAAALESTQLALYCWRGGMRSESMAWLFERYGLETVVLEGGYKTYRRAVLQFFDQRLPIVVLTGYTGSQKTRMLHLMREEGAQVIDLEGLANHQGSSFGNRKSSGQPATEHFQNLVYEAFIGMDFNRPIWIEDESKHIGQVSLPDALYDQKSNCPHVFVEIEPAERVDFLVQDYGELSAAQLIAATHSIQPKLGNDKATKAITAIESGDLKTAASLILTYYDSRYRKSIQRKSKLIQKHYQIPMAEIPNLAQELARWHPKS